MKERSHFWNSVPSRTMCTAIAVDMVVAVLITAFGIPWMTPLPLTITLVVIGYSFVFSLLVNDFKYFMAKKHEIRW